MEPPSEPRSLALAERLEETREYLLIDHYHGHRREIEAKLEALSLGSGGG
jgi:hypothetical protein